MNPISNYLNVELDRRKAKNENFSLRAFARFLDIEPSALSKIIKGQRVPSETTVLKISRRLKISSEDFHKIQTWMSQSKEVQKGKETFATFDNEDFEKRIGPDHLILLEALRIPVFADSLGTLREAAGMDSIRFQQIITDLEKMNLLDYDPKNNRVQILKSHNTTLPLDLPSEKRREIQKKFLKLAIEAIDRVPFTERENSTLTVAIPSSQIAYFQKLIGQMRRKLNSEADKRLKKADTVYNFTVAFYPVVK